MTADLARLVARQRGLFTRAQARGCGYSDYQVRRRIRTGEWQVVLGPVLAARGAVSTRRLIDLAAVLAIPQGVLAGPSAARCHEMPVDDERTWLAVPASAHPRVPGVALLRGPLPAADLRTIKGVRVTSRARTVFDCLRVLPERPALDLLDRALQQRWITVPELARRVGSFAGRHGVGRLVRLVSSAGSGARSAAERRAVELLTGAGIEGWEVNGEIRDAEGELIGIADIVFRVERVVIELDGRAYHVSADQFEHDRYRQNQLVERGWTVLRFTWRDLTGRPGYVVDTVRRLVADQA